VVVVVVVVVVLVVAAAAAVVAVVVTLMRQHPPMLKHPTTHINGWSIGHTPRAHARLRFLALDFDRRVVTAAANTTSLAALSLVFLLSGLGHRGQYL
jgi:hypothetical protein